MKNSIKWLVLCLLIVVGISGCGFLKTVVEDPFAGNWIGIVKVPGMGKSLLRVTIEPEEKERYSVRATAENYQRKKTGESASDKTVFVWQPGAELRFTGQLESDTLQLNRMMHLSLMLSKVTGKLQFPDGTEISRDTGKEYPVLKEELRKKVQEEFPEATFEDKKTEDKTDNKTKDKKVL